MNRAETVSRSLQYFCLIFCIAIVSIPEIARAVEKKQPLNLLIIHTDEHHFNTLGCYGGSIVKTPNIDWIAENGAKCNSFYATTPVCSPSRASLVSGLYPQKTPIVTNDIPLDDSIITFAEILRRQGYATGYAGKWHLDGKGKPQWAPKRKFGFEDNRFMFNRGHWKKLVDGPDGPRVGSRKKGAPSYDLAGANEKTFATDWLCDKAIDFIQENKHKSFCYMVSLPDPHGPNTVRAPYDTMYENISVQIPVTFNRKTNQIPQWGLPAKLTKKQLKKLMIQYYGMVKCIDDNVGNILTKLRQEKLLDRTIVIFTSDHGDLCGQHGRINKGVPYEGSARIPFLIHCPGKIKPNTVIEEALGVVDFLPTVMSLMDVEVKHSVDGRDASSLFTGQADQWDDMTFIRSTPGTPWIGAVTKQYKLIFSTKEHPWLIDVKNDPNELTNIIDQPQHRKLVQQLTARLQEYGVKHNDEHIDDPRIKSWINDILQQE